MKSFFKHPEVWMLFVTLSWGINNPVMKHIITDIDPWTFAGLRFILICILSVSSFYLIQKERFLFRIDAKRDLVWLIAAGFFAYGGYQFFFMEGLSRTPAFLATLLVCLSPIFATIISYLLKMERYTWRVWVGIGISFIGIFIFKYTGSLDTLFTGSFIGELYCMGAALCWAGYSIIMKSETIQKYPKGQVNTLTLFFGTAIVLLYSIDGVVSYPINQITPFMWALISYTVIFPIFIAYKFYNLSIQKMGIERTIIFVYLTPIFSGLISIGLGMEDFNIMKLIGSVVVIFGMMLAKKG